MLPPGNAQIIGQREDQQDYFATFFVADALVAVVADGMGGYSGGDQASEQALKAFNETLRGVDLTDIPNDLRNALDTANNRLTEVKAAQPGNADMGTTLVALVIKNDLAYWVSVGDSPLFRLRNDALERLNTNHSMAEELDKAVAAGSLTRQQALDDPDYHLITSALTGAPIPLVDCLETGISVQPGDRFLIASDGIHSVSDREIERVLCRGSNAQQAANRLTERVEKHADPAQDNCTVVTVFTAQPARYGKKLIQAMLALVILICVLFGGLYLFRPDLLVAWNLVGSQSEVNNRAEPAEVLDKKPQEPVKSPSSSPQMDESPGTQPGTADTIEVAPDDSASLPEQKKSQPTVKQAIPKSAEPEKSNPAKITSENPEVIAKPSPQSKNTETSPKDLKQP